MALRKEPYGLVYNTDGSLCTTVRPDQIPFQGVNSWAVEEATTNLFDSFRVGSGISNIQNPADDPTGKFSSVIRINPKSASTYYGKDITTVVDSPYSGQVWCYVSNDFDGTGIVGLYCEKGLSKLKAYYNKSKKGTWQLLKKENILATSTTGRLLLYVFRGFETGFVLFARQQVEQKPFATSYVDGSRPMGYMQFVDERFDRNNLVIAQWKKTISTDTQVFSTTNFGRYRADFSDFYGYFGWRWIYGLYLYTTEGSTYKYVDFNTIYNQWVFEVFVIDGLTARYKILGENIDEMLTTSLTGVKPWNNMIYYQAPSKYNIGLISNIFIGKYRRPDGTVIWTDDYIREVYEAKIPFTEQNKLLIY